MKIIVENSTWNNLGDGFYQFALFELIKKIFPNDEVFYGEGPIQRSFKPSKKHEKNALKLNEHQKADIHIISGPMLGKINKPDYQEMIKNILNSGNNYALISCSSAGVEGNKLQKVKDFIKEYPPIAFSSRDPLTYQNFSNVIPNAYNGICTAFLVDKLLKVDTLDIGKEYFVSSYYRQPEPEFHSKLSSPNIEDIIIKPKKPIIPFLPWKINRHLEFYQNSKGNVGEVEIIRTVQQVSTKSNYFNFKYPNSYISWNPITFLSAFKGAKFTISERVHACATTLAFGKPARLMIDNPRNGIFDRFGLDYKSNDGIMYPYGLNEKIDEELMKLSVYIKNQISN